MSIRLGLNISSLRAIRQLEGATGELALRTERLASGLRINRASDDAAGLSIATTLGANARVYSTGIRNANDGISALNIADGALSSLTDIVIRITELAEQSANGTFSSRQRQALDREGQALSDEFERIARTTKFNGRALLDGSVQTLDIQVGIEGGANSRILLDLGDGASHTAGNGTFQTATVLTGDAFLNTVTTGDVNKDGHVDLITGTAFDIGIRLGTGNGTFGALTLRSRVGTADQRELILKDLNNDTYLDIITAGATQAAYYLNNGSGGFNAGTLLGAGRQISAGDINNDGWTDIVASDFAGSQIEIYLNNQNGTFTTQAPINDLGATAEVVLADFNRDNNLDVVSSYGTNQFAVRLGTGLGTFGGATTYNTTLGVSSLVVGDFTGDSAPEIIATRTSSGTIDIFLNNGTGTFSLGSSPTVGTGGAYHAIGDLNDDGNNDLVLESGDQLHVRLGTSSGTFTGSTSYTDSADPRGVAFGDFNEDGGIDMVATDVTNNEVNIFTANTQTTVGLPSFSLLTAAEARDTLTTMQTQIQTLAEARGLLGIGQSRLLVAVRNNLTSRENSIAARGRIAEADIATESAEAVRVRIRQQVAAAVLKSTNLIPELAVKLLN